MVATPFSRKGRIFSGLSVFVTILIFLQLRPSWRERSYDYAVGISDKVTNYLSSYREYDNTLYQAGNEEVVSQYHNFSDPCAGFPNMDGIQVVIKTGATEAFDKIPTQLLTVLQCLPDFLIFSDMEQQIGKHHIYDALSTIDEGAKAHNSDFDLYNKQKSCPVSQKSCVDSKAEKDHAWQLDKYKFIPMMEQTWQMRPGRDWYIFIEADTYVFWPNLVDWLRSKSSLNHREKLYIGSRTWVGSMPFAHGGSGYLMTGTLLRRLVENHPGLTHQYTLKGPNECCGDLLLGQAIFEYEDVKIRQTWPMINGEKPSTLPFGPGHWCEPLLTMHHMNAEEISNVWQFEQTRKKTSTLLIRDIYDALVAPKMQVMRHDWDNLSDDVCFVNPEMEAEGAERDRQKDESEMTAIEKDAWKSAEHCAKVCAQEDVQDEEDWDLANMAQHPSTEDGGIAASGDMDDTEMRDENGQYNRTDIALDKETWRNAMTEKKKNRTCFQYRWHDGVCCTSASFKMGEAKARPEVEKERWISGWNLKGINDWIAAMGECEPEWKVPEPS
ncbi:hypothetical protein BX600DRAFT_434328 [Xylariales sp. PMI_506]|nr:hypothetical protein BX600DRAFT_434328 [Xylariales sp. PMI_506]